MFPVKRCVDKSDTCGQCRTYPATAIPRETAPEHDEIRALFAKYHPGEDNWMRHAVLWMFESPRRRLRRVVAPMAIDWNYGRELFPISGMVYEFGRRFTLACPHQRLYFRMYTKRRNKSQRFFVRWEEGQSIGRWESVYKDAIYWFHRLSFFHRCCSFESSAHFTLTFYSVDGEYRTDPSGMLFHTCLQNRIDLYHNFPPTANQTAHIFNRLEQERSLPFPTVLTRLCADYVTLPLAYRPCLFEDNELTRCSNRVTPHMVEVHLGILKEMTTDERFEILARLFRRALSIVSAIHGALATTSRD